MSETTGKRPRRGRPPREAATAHDDILDAVHEILQAKSVRDLTIGEVAERAGVGKPTIYRWWPSKAALVMDMFEARVAPRFGAAAAATAEATIRRQVASLIRLLNGFFGKVSAEIIAEGQSEPDVLREYRERYVLRRRAFSQAVIERAQAGGEFRRDVDPQLLIDLVYGPIYYRLLVGHQKLDQRFGDALVDAVMTSLRAQPAAATIPSKRRGSRPRSDP